MLSTSSMRYRASMLSALVLCAGVAASLPDMSPAERDAAETGPVGYGLMMDAGSTGISGHRALSLIVTASQRPINPHEGLISIF